MRLPCEYYLRALLVGGESRWPIMDVQDHVVRMGYPTPSRDYLVMLRDALEDSRPKPYLVGGQAPRKWLMEQKLWGICHSNATADTAFEILTDAETRPVMEPLVISGIKTSFISSYFKELTGMEVSEEVVNFYQHFFWNRGLLRQEEWMEFLDKYPDGDHLAICYIADADYTLYHLGVKTDMDIREMIRETARQAYYRLQEARLLPLNKDTAQIFKHHAEVLVQTNREIGATTALGKLLEQMREVGLKTRSIDFKLLAELPEGEVLDGTVLSEVVEGAEA